MSILRRLWWKLTNYTRNIGKPRITPSQVEDVRKFLVKVAIPPWKDGFYHFERDEETGRYLPIRESDGKWI